tara:strand:+ start:2435 stop:2929 length:495 start_codon:yes stop_codon:yes gene_type:complete
MNTENDFAMILKNTQLVSIDLIIYNDSSHVLLGKRNNEPAKNMYFTPGGRTFKLEAFEDAVKRISKNEVGFELSNGKIHGVYHHIYPNNFRDEDVSTHYVNFAYKFVDIGSPIATIESVRDSLDAYTNQHCELKWFSIPDLMSSDEVHQNVKNYFHTMPPNKIC